MKKIFARQTLPDRNMFGIIPNSIFLVGPTPRSNTVASWRPRALELLKEKKFDGTVLIPEDAEGVWDINYYDQIWWEIQALGGAACVLAWLDRKLPDMPAFTTNTEIGFLLTTKPDRLVMGAPEDAEKVKYQLELAKNIDKFFDAFCLPKVITGPKISSDLEVCVEMAIMRAKT